VIFNLRSREVSGQLIIDAARYKQHQDCRALVCLVYDSGRLVKNPRGLDGDLAKLSGDGLIVACKITP
jgi:hypothetical protein